MRKVIKEKEFTVIIEGDYNKFAFDCPVCGFAMRDALDMVSLKNYDCCADCQDLYYWPNLEKWKSGWRPILSKNPKTKHNYKIENMENENEF